MTERLIAAQLYEAYARHAAWHRADGCRMVAFGELPDKEKAHWMAVAEQAISILWTGGEVPSH